MLLEDDFTDIIKKARQGQRLERLRLATFGEAEEIKLDDAAPAPGASAQGVD